MPQSMVGMRIGYINSGTMAILAKSERKIARFSILTSNSVGVGEETLSIVSRDLGREAPRDTSIMGIATAPAVSIARNSELCRNPVVLKNNSC